MNVSNTNLYLTTSAASPEAEDAEHNAGSQSVAPRSPSVPAIDASETNSEETWDQATHVSSVPEVTLTSGHQPNIDSNSPLDDEYQEWRAKRYSVALFLWASAFLCVALMLVLVVASLIKSGYSLTLHFSFWPIVISSMQGAVFAIIFGALILLHYKCAPSRVKTAAYVTFIPVLLGLCLSKYAWSGMAQKLQRTISSDTQVYPWLPRGLLRIWALMSTRSFVAFRMPESTRACVTRVTNDQSLLFTLDVYRTQFHEYTDDDMTSWFNQTQFQQMRSDTTLCGQGFIGNSDLYGLGVRMGIYLQWLSSMMANHLLEQERKTLQRTFLVLSMAITMATFIISFTSTCTFSIEIELLYWMYWGGFLCVIFSAPEEMQIDSKIKGFGLRWSQIAIFSMHMLMTYHGIWYVFFAYDNTFARMPCGTYHFLAGKMLDPSETFFSVRDLGQALLAAFAMPLLVVFPVIAILLASEVKAWIQMSEWYQLYFLTNRTSNINPSTVIMVRYTYQKAVGLYGLVREQFGLPTRASRRIRLLTAADIQCHRNDRMRSAVLGLVTFTLSIVAIELNLKWNQIQNVNSLISMGQTVPLMVGVGSFVALCWQLFHHEGVRRLKLRQRNAATGLAANATELGTDSGTFARNPSHALFRQPDVDFLTNSGSTTLPS